MLKLIHLVDDKMHRATGPYSDNTTTVTRKSSTWRTKIWRNGSMGVRRIWSSFYIKKLLTIKSDDMQGRNETLNAIVKGQQIPKFGIPESFKVFIMNYVQSD
jgi:DNA-directed RNA polymerase subunit beta